MTARLDPELLLSGRQRGLASALRCLLRCGEPLYGAGVQIRNKMFDHGLLKIHRAEIPVISVGNITTGGTGKTPIVRWIIEQILSRGKKPVIISRGYHTLKGTRDNPLGNDEFLELQATLTGVCHLQNPDRLAAARQAATQWGAEVVVLDDGFQHRRLARDLDIVLVDATRPFGYGHLLPRGLLREPIASLRRADLILLTRVTQVSQQTVTELVAELSQVSQNKPIVQVAFVPQGLINLENQFIDLDAIGQKAVLGFCAIGNPAAFREMLLKITGSLADFKNFPDHYQFVDTDIQDLQQTALHLNAQTLVCTMKDLVKLPDLKRPKTELLALVLSTCIVAGEMELASAIGRTLRATG